MGKHDEKGGRTGNPDQDNGRHRKGHGYGVGGHTAGREKSSSKGWSSNGDDDRNSGEDMMRKRP